MVMTIVSTSDNNVQCGHDISPNLVYLALIFVPDFFGGSDSAIIRTLVASVVAVIHGILLHVSGIQHAIVERQTVRHLPAQPEEFYTPNIHNRR